jgi:hypothetical protein
MDADLIKKTDDLNVLSAWWLEQKEAEKKATDLRRTVEDRIKSLAGIAENLEGTETVSPSGFTLKIVGRIDYKIDADKLQEVAAESGLSDHLGTLFRWKPEINMSIWKATDASITKALSSAITAKPGRASFTITANKE